MLTNGARRKMDRPKIDSNNSKLIFLPSRGSKRLKPYLTFGITKNKSLFQKYDSFEAQKFKTNQKIANKN